MGQEMDLKKMKGVSGLVLKQRSYRNDSSVLAVCL
jgi:hypothetical protein